MKNSDIMAAINMLNKGMNPNMIVSMLAKTNPQVGQIMKLLNGKSDAEMWNFVQNIAKERGVDLDEYARSLGITIPSNR